MNTRILVYCVVFVGTISTFLVIDTVTNYDQAQYTLESSVSKRENMRSRGYSKRHVRILNQRREAVQNFEQSGTP